MEGRGDGYWFLLWSYPNFVADCCCTGVRTFLLKVHTSLLPFNISVLCLYSLFFLFVDLWHFKIPASRPCWLSSLLVLSCTPSTPVFSSPQKPTFSNSNSTRNQVDLERLSGCTNSKSLFICNSFLAVVASGMAVVCKRTVQQFPTKLAPAVNRGKYTTHKTFETMCNARAGPKNVGRVKQSGVGGRKREEKTRIFPPLPLSFFPPSTYP